MNTDDHENVEQIEDLSDLEEADRIEINILGLLRHTSSNFSRLLAPPMRDATVELVESKSDKCKRCCATNYHPYKKIPILKWIQEYELRRGSN